MESNKKFQKINELKHRVVTVVKNIWHIFYSYWKRNFGDTYKGLAICSILFSSIGMAGDLMMYFSPLSIEISYLVGLVLTIILLGLLFLVTKILFGNRRKALIYWCLPFFFLYTTATSATQDDRNKANFFLAVITIILLDFFGRSMWAIIKLRRRTITLVITLVITASGLGSIGAFLTDEGFKDQYIEDYLAMRAEKEADDNQNKVDDAFADAIKRGKFETTSLEYGIGNSFDLQSTVYNISPFAQRGSVSGWVMDQYFDYDLREAPITGKVWYPVSEQECPVLFIVHGNHNYTTDSYLGYDYLGKYLASNGYVVVSVNENSCNELSNENDARAILLLENIKQVLKYNQDKTNPLYGKIDEENIAIAGHSRGGECVSTAYLFNEYDVYPDNGNIKFDYNFSIKSIISIAPTADQYMPAQHEVSISDVNYLLIHGTNDQDVLSVMGNKLYKNTTFSGEGNYFKSVLYVAGANHGQFNSEWGRYDVGFPNHFFLNVKNLISTQDQKEILKIFTKIFLDVTLKGDETNKELFSNYQAYEKYLPETVYQQMYQDSSLEYVSNFEEDSDLTTATMEGAKISTSHTRIWEEMKTTSGNGTNENYALRMKWRGTNEATVKFEIPNYEMTGKNLQFDIADMNEENLSNEKQLIDGTVRITDSLGNVANVKISDCTFVYPTLPVQLYKIDFLSDMYEYKHQMQTVCVTTEQFLADNSNIDTDHITSVEIIFDEMESGQVKIDNVGFGVNDK